jgi:hypothetical protein
MRPGRWWAIPAAIQDVCRDFAERLARRDRMLLSHRFWSLVASIDESLTDPVTTHAMKWMLEASFGGYEGDELRLRLFVGEPARRYRPSDEDHCSEVTLGEFASDRAQAIPLSLANAVQAGAIPLTERDGGRWTFDGRFPAPDESVVLLASPELHAQLGDVGRPWISLGSGWHGSGRLSKGELEVVRARLHGVIEDDPAETLIAFKIDGGVRTGRSTYLGRPGFLPHLHASCDAPGRAFGRGQRGSRDCGCSAPRGPLVRSTDDRSVETDGHRGWI